MIYLPCHLQAQRLESGRRSFLEKEVALIKFDKFERLPEGEKPFRILDSHPDGEHLVMQTVGIGPDRSGVWHKETGSLLWLPSESIALGWLHQGTQIAVLRSVPTFPPYEVALYSWPEKHLLRRCPLSLPQNASPIDLVIAPTNDLALCHWWWEDENDESGFEYLDMTEQAITQDLSVRYAQPFPPEIVTRAIFGPSGSLWVCCAQHFDAWWAADPTDPDPYESALGGQYLLGDLLIFQGKELPPRSLPLIATLPAGWRPADPMANESTFISDPVFLDAYHVQVRLPSEEVQIHQVAEV